MGDVIAPEVRELQQTAKFFRENGKEFVAISFVGEKDTVIRKVLPEHMAKFRSEWNAFCDGAPMKQRDGTPLTEVMNLSEDVAQKYVLQNVHTAEELAVLSDSQCQALGHGTLTFRAAARGLLDQRKIAKMEAAQKRIGEVTKEALSLAAAEAKAEADAKYASKEDVEAVKSELGDIKGMLAQLLERKKPGPKPKDQAE